MRAAAGALPTDRLMVGTGAAALADAIELTRAAGDLGYSAALVLPPFYYKDVRAEGLLSFFRRVSEASAIGIYLYNFPQLTGLRFEPELVEALVEACPGRILGMKDSSGDLGYAKTIVNLGLGLAVFPSSEAVLIEARSGKFAGCISATACLSPDLCAQAWRYGNADAQLRACAMRSLAAQGPLIPRIKAALAAELNDPQLANVLPPHEPLTEADRYTLFSRLQQARAG
jgi:4-hydroxy-tetrahydrodipicolinate synthase